jgi:hypothetical protein
MRPFFAVGAPPRGITVLGLLLLIIAVIVTAVFLIGYLRSRPAAMSFHQPLDQLNLPRVVEVVRGNAVNLLGVGPHPFG